MKPIILIGMMGSGKTTIGKALAQDLSLRWMDTDQYIEQQEQQSISNLFSQHGEAYFRQCETKALQHLISQAKIISTGGGIIITTINRNLLKKNANVIYLKAQIDTLIARLDATDRPLLQNEDIKSKLSTLYEQRQSWYEECAHHTIETDSLNIEEVVRAIKQTLDL